MHVCLHLYIKTTRVKYATHELSRHIVYASVYFNIDDWLDRDKQAACSQRHRHEQSVANSHLPRAICRIVVAHCVFKDRWLMPLQTCCSPNNNCVNFIALFYFEQFVFQWLDVRPVTVVNCLPLTSSHYAIALQAPYFPVLFCYFSVA